MSSFEWNVSDSDLERCLSLVKDCQSDLTSAAQNSLISANDADDSLAYGLQPNKLKSLVDYFACSYDFREQERKFNAMGEHRLHRVSSDEGDFDIHFVHARSEDANAIPLLLSHGVRRVSCICTCR